MHESAYRHMADSFERYYIPHKHKVVLDVGSRAVSGHKLTHKDIVKPHDLKYIGVDVVEGPNVDVVMKEPYRLPLRSQSVDIIFCGQVFEHVPYFWVTFLEMARVLRGGGVIFLSAPSRGHRHSPPTDCWRFYPDGMRSLAKFADLKLLRAHTDFPPKQSDNSRLDYSRISEYRYWGDTVGVFQKTRQYRRYRGFIMRELLIRWSNKRSVVKPNVAPQKNHA